MPSLTPSSSSIYPHPMQNRLHCDLRLRSCRKTTILLVLALFAITTTVLLCGTGSPTSNTRPAEASDISKQTFAPCTRKTEAWRTIQSKYDTLIEDKFTVAVSTFHRPKELKRILGILLSDHIPSLLEVVVIWNNFGEEPPAAYDSEHGVRVRYRIPPRDSLNEKLWPDPEYRTQAVLLSDDDVYYRAEDLEFVFQSWRKFGKDRMTGALARCATPDNNGQWEYTFCTGHSIDKYSIILSNLAFAHIGLLDYYFSDDPAMTAVRDLVDDKFNCEDIALNFAASLLTGSGPLLVQGRDQYVNLDPSTGISRNSGHMEARSQCLNDFAHAFQCMPLVDESARIERGYKFNVWYKSLWDRLTYR
uniref:Glycosyl transferase 64 domain-containing protein n=1 Tax=Bionectria ochroleuca TaxID=29856 RepID=A0A8H7NI93_BIOOC